MTRRQILAGIVLAVMLITVLAVWVLPGFIYHPIGYCVGAVAQVRACRGYGFWSGIAGSFATSSGLWTGVFLLYWKHQCHHHGCLWPSFHAHSDHGLLCKKHYQVAGGQIPGKHYPLTEQP